MYWCSQWDCCKPPELEMDDSDFEEPPTTKTTPCFASPVSPSNMDTICRGYVPPNTKKATSWAVHTFEQWQDQQNEKSKFAAHCDLLSLSISHILENICIAQNILENMNTTQDALSGTRYNAYSFALMFRPPGLQEILCHKKCNESFLICSLNCITQTASETLLHHCTTSNEANVDCNHAPWLQTTNYHTHIMYADMTLDYLQYWWLVGHSVPLLQI